jgi:hypothetical protein
MFTSDPIDFSDVNVKSIVFYDIHENCIKRLTLFLYVHSWYCNEVVWIYLFLLTSYKFCGKYSRAHHHCHVSNLFPFMTCHQILHRVQEVRYLKCRVFKYCYCKEWSTIIPVLCIIDVLHWIDLH